MFQLLAGKNWFVGLLIFVWLASLWLPSVAAANEPKIVRVGYFHYNGYHMIQDGVYSGYGYEYLQHLKQYGNWQFEYIGYDKNWNDMLDMLERGEIDVVTLAQKTPERTARFAYSQPIGSVQAVITVKAGNDEFIKGDYNSFNDIKVAMMWGNACNQDFMEFAAEKGFVYKPLFYYTTEELRAALQSGEVDATVNSNMQGMGQEWIAAEFAPQPFYAVFRKDDDELRREFDEAIQNLEMTTPDLPERLMKKYYTVSRDSVPFTFEERQYLEELKTADARLTVFIEPDCWPLSYYKGTTASGIIPEIAMLVGEKIGIPVYFRPTNHDDENVQLRADEFGIRFDELVDFYKAEQGDYSLTHDYLNLTFSMVTLNSFHDDIKSLATVRNINIDHLTMSNLNERYKITYYDNDNECIAAVKNGTNDAALLYTYTAQYQIYKDGSRFLRTNMTSLPSVQLAAAISPTADKRLLNVLNRVIQSLPQAEIDKIVMHVTDYSISRPSLIDYIYFDPQLSMLIFGSLCLFLLVLVVNYFVMKNNNLQYQQNRDFKHFISCVCESNDQVSEIDLEKGMVRTYSVNDGRVQVEVNDYIYGEVFINQLHPDDRKQYQEFQQRENFENFIREGHNKYFEARRLELDGQYRWYAYSLQGKEKDDGKYSSCILFCRDIDKARLEEQRQKDALSDALELANSASKAKGVFLSRMSHEIRTPLNAVIGYINMIKMCENDKASISHYLTQCETAAHHLLKIINDVLDISSVESGKLKIAAEPFELRKLVGDITAMFTSRAQEAGVEFRVRVYDVTEEHLIGDQLRINQIMLNLLSNAVKFTPAGNMVEFIISQTAVRDDSVQLKFIVRDRGIGMAPEYLQRIFKPFEQADASIAQKYGGTGLGLSITYNLVQMMKGSIEVESELNKGTTFTVHLSFNKIETANDKSASLDDMAKIRLLIVNDDKQAAHYIKSILKNFHVKGEIASGTAEAVRQIKRRYGTAYAYNACLVDLSAEGGQSAEEIHTADEELPVILAAPYTYKSSKAERTWLHHMEQPVFQSTLFNMLTDIFVSSASGENNLPEKIINMQGLRVLIAEDNAMNMEIAVGILEKFGMKLTLAENGEMVVEKFVNSQPGDFQLILMDVQMPVMSGYEATRAIRQSNHPDAAAIPIIAMTANAFNEDVSEALAAGMNDHIAKPVEYKKLFAAINRLVKNNSAEE